MIGPTEGVPAQTFTLRNTSGKDVRFTGWKLAEVDNFKPDGSARWKERAVYQTEAGRIICHKLGRSKLRGEVDRGEVHVVKTVGAVRADTGNRLVDEFLRGQPPVPTADEQVADFFRGDSLAKDLFDELGIADVDEIE